MMIDTKIEKTFAADAYGTTHPCVHTPCCPTADDTARDAAHVISARPEQGWSLLCNGVVVFEDFGELLPNGQCIDSRRVDLLAASPHRRSA